MGYSVCVCCKLRALGLKGFVGRHSGVPMLPRASQLVQDPPISGRLGHPIPPQSPTYSQSMHTHTHTSCGKTSGDQTRGTTSVKTKASEGRALVTETISSGH